MEDVIIFGTGGHAKVVYDILVKQAMYKPVAFVSLNENLTDFLGIPHLNQNKFKELKVKKGVVAIGDNSVRSSVVDFIQSQISDFEFVSAVHPSAQIGNDVKIGRGSVIMAQTAVNSGTRIGQHVILNTSSSVDHDCIIGDYSSIAPGAILGGNVKVGNFSAVSLGCHIIHGKSIGDHTVIGAGAVVIEDITDHKVAYGNPCKVIKMRQTGEKYL